MNTQDTLKQKLIENLNTVNSLSITTLEGILFAYDIAETSHNGQFRDGGAPYITHPVEGCIMMARDYGIQNSNLYIAFLLHDTGEDARIFGDRVKLTWSEFKHTFTTRVSRIFGETVAQTVLLLTKPSVDGSDFQSKSDMMSYYLRNLEQTGQVQNFAVFGKMIDRLHNLRSLLPENASKIHKQIAETEGLLLPLFERVAQNLVSSTSSEMAEPDFERKFGLVIRDIKTQIAILKEI